ncbi:DUF433 domain-containing protein [Ferruginivarius sediminum]|uniref:DUF433 domain-containing protein n=1 Tax=Ferruginivarius sediminum TaxID=2661937 RepID=UPI003BAAB763
MLQKSLIVSDPEIHNVAPIFAGTRVRVAEVVLTLAKGADMAHVRQTWPSLSDAQLDLVHHLAFISAVAEGEASASRGSGRQFTMARWPRGFNTATAARPIPVLSGTP